jgi:proton glutamate symport protein
MTAADSATIPASRPPRLNVGSQVFIALGLGIAVGVFAGEHVAFLGIVGHAYILLLQITVIPYVAMSLITALGRLTLRDARNLGLKAGVLLLALWALGLVMVLLSPLAFPDWPSASFFSTSQVDPPARVDFLQLYIPANPFFSFANAVVPAIVVFCALLGLSLTNVRNKEALLQPLTAVSDALMAITEMISRIAPYGIFALTANAAGTIEIDELSRLQVYIATNVSIALLLSVWLLPALITALTPLHYGEVMKRLREPLITAFATGSLLVVLPGLAVACKDLLAASAQRGHRIDVAEAGGAVDVLLPAAYNFPTLGVLLSLMFLLFAGWFVGTPVPIADYPVLASAGIASLFGGTSLALPFLLDLLKLPQDLLQLFFAMDVIISRFGTLLAAIHVAAIGLIGAFVLQGSVRIQWLLLLRLAFTSIVLILVVLGGMRAFFTYMVAAPYTKDRALREMTLLTPQQPTQFLAHPSPNAVSKPVGIAEIRRRGVLRACYFPENYPSSFLNDAHPRQLVGFDVDMTHRLALMLGVSIELLAADTLEEVSDYLRRGLCDVHMSGFPITPAKTESFLMTAPVLRSSVGFIVRDHRREQFESWRAMRDGSSSLRVGVLPDPDAMIVLRTLVPQSSVVAIADRSRLDSLLASGTPEVDAVITTSEEGAAWTLLYPEYTLIVPKPVLFAPVGYAVAVGNEGLVRALDAWLTFEQAQGTIDAFYRYWMLGQPQQGENRHRWSILRDVLHWVD